MNLIGNVLLQQAKFLNLKKIKTLKTTINYFITLVLIQSSFIHAQQSFNGEALYIAELKTNIKIDSASSPPISSKNILQSALVKKSNNGFRETYVLQFDSVSSLYKKEEKLETPQPNGVRFSADVGLSGDKLYKNLKKGRYTIENEIFGKLFIVKDSLKEYNWKLVGETKKIGNYTCYKATRTYKKQVADNKYFSFSSVKNSEPRTKEIEVTIVAWFTLEIPISTGPGIHHGLPGLILEINDHNIVILCTKITLNKKDIKIKEPKHGRKVNQAEFDEIYKKKQQEINENGS